MNLAAEGGNGKGDGNGNGNGNRNGHAWEISILALRLDRALPLIIRPV